MGSPKKASVRALQETHFDCLPLRDHKPQTPQTKWLRVQDQRRPRRAAPTSSPSFPRGKSRSSRRLSVSWTQTRTVFCPQVTFERSYGLEEGRRRSLSYFLTANTKATIVIVI